MKRIKILGLLSLVALIALAGVYPAKALHKMVWAPSGVDAADVPVAYRSLDNPRGTVYGVCTTWLGAVDYNDCFYGSIDLASGKVSKIYNNARYNGNSEMDVTMQTCAVRNGHLFIPDYRQDMITGDVAVMWHVVDLATGKWGADIDMTNQELSFCYALTYNPRDDKFYGLAIDMKKFSFGWLVKIDPTTWKVEPMGTTDAQGAFQGINVGGKSGDFMANLAYCPLDGKLYGVKDTGSFYSINTRTGSVSKVADFQDNAQYVTPSMMSTPLVYSPLDKAFVTLYNDMEHPTRIVYIDMDQGYYDVYLGETLKGGYRFCNLVCPDSYAQDEAPAEPKIKSIDFNGAATTGKAVIEAPTERYDGSSLGDAQLQVKVLLDATELFSGAMAPGESKTLDIATERGEHTLAVTAKSGEYESPTATATFFVGYDEPQAPKSVFFDPEEQMVLWTASPSKGVHGGVVDMAMLSYDVYIDGMKLNTAPILGNFYKIEDMSGIEFGLKSITVTAVSNGLYSMHSEPVEAVFGRAMELPLNLKPSAQQSTLFQTLDANHDGDSFRYEASSHSFGLEGQYFNSPDDWLFLPLAAYPSVDHLYSLKFRYANYWENEAHRTDLEVFIGKEADPRAMTGRVYSHSNDYSPSWKDASVLFAINEPGDYYIGFHTMGSGSGYRGIRLSNFVVESMADVTSEVPADPSDVKFEAAPLGALRAHVSMKLPALDMTGNALAADAIVKVAIENQEGGSITLSGAPGATVEGDIEVKTDGFNSFYVTPSIEGVGTGVRRQFRAYVGLDVPAVPQNFRADDADDNMSVTLSWDAPTAGENGGFVNPDDITYGVYWMDGITRMFIENTKATTYTFQVPREDLKSYYFVIYATNGMGESRSSKVLHQVLGKPYELPAKETFGSTGFDMYPWTGSSENSYSEWLSIGVLPTGKLSFADGTGGVSCSPDARGNKGGMLYIPKVTTLNYDDAKFEFTFHDYSSAPDYELWGRHNGNHEYVKIADVDVNRPIKEEWHQWSCPLPAEFQNRSWVQLAIIVKFNGRMNEAATIDDIAIRSNVEYDFKVSALEGPVDVNVGDVAKYVTTFVNSGQESATSQLTVELLGDGTSLEKIENSFRRLPAGTVAQFVSEFEMKEEYLQYDKLEVKSTIFTAKDEVEINNTKVLEVELHESTLPTVTEISASWSDSGKGAVVSWAEPDLAYGDYDSFEGLRAFVATKEMHGQWKNVDGDGKPRFTIGGLRWDGDDKAGAWEVIDAEKLNVLEDERLAPHSGKSYLMARCPSFDESDYGSDVPWAEDWLISPEIKGGSRVDFWMNTISSGYQETIEVWYSTTDDNIESMTKLRNFTKSGTEAWEHCAFTLPAGAKYFAFKYHSQGKFGVMIDDVQLTLKSPSKWEIVSYSVYVSTDPENAGYKLLVDRLADTSVEDMCSTEADRYYYVVPYVKDDVYVIAGNKSKVVTLTGTGVDRVEALAGVYGGKGVIKVVGHAGKQMTIYCTDGKMLVNAAIDSDSYAVAVEPGIYVARIGNATATIAVK